MKKNILFFLSVSLIIGLTSCNVVSKVEKKEKVNNIKDSNYDSNANYNDSMETQLKYKSIAEVREEITEMNGVMPVVTDKDEIYIIKITKLEGNDLRYNGDSIGTIRDRNDITTTRVYRNDYNENINKISGIEGKPTILQVAEQSEDYLNNKFNDSNFKWMTEYIDIYTTPDKKSYVHCNIRPVYDGVPFTGQLVPNDENKVCRNNTAEDFRSGNISIWNNNEVKGYGFINPYYDIEKQGEPISEIVSVETVIDIVSSKIGDNAENYIKMFELDYSLNKNSYIAKPIWYVVVNINGVDRNFQIDAVSGEIYFE